MRSKKFEVTATAVSAVSTGKLSPFFVHVLNVFFFKFEVFFMIFDLNVELEPVKERFKILRSLETHCQCVGLQGKLSEWKFLWSLLKLILNACSDFIS